MTEPSSWATLVPELLVRDIGKSLRFWRDICGFVVVFDRPDEGFAYLDLEGAQIMLDEIGKTRDWLTGPLEAPFGRGVNFQVRVPAVEPILVALAGAGWPLFMDPERKWYRTGDVETGVHQFLVQDPDGYLIRFSAYLGERPLGAEAIKSSDRPHSMYQPRTPGYRKSNAEMRWALPDRVFLACGACHILAYAFLQRWGRTGMQAVWIKPAPGYWGNHVFIDGGEWVFDYHGYSAKPRFLAHIWRGARQRWPGWDATLVELPPDVLISEQKSLTFEGLHLREPDQFLHDAMPRAEAYLNRFGSRPKQTKLASPNVDH